MSFSLNLEGKQLTIYLQYRNKGQELLLSLDFFSCWLLALPPFLMHWRQSLPCVYRRQFRSNLSSFGIHWLRWRYVLFLSAPTGTQAIAFEISNTCVTIPRVKRSAWWIMNHSNHHTTNYSHGCPLENHPVEVGTSKHKTPATQFTNCQSLICCILIISYNTSIEYIWPSIITSEPCKVLQLNCREPLYTKEAQY